MSTADAIMLALREHGPMAKTALFRAAAAKVDESKQVHGQYGDYPEDGYDTLEFLDNLGFIQCLAGKYSLTDRGKKFCEEVLEKKGDTE